METILQVTCPICSKKSALSIINHVKTHGFRSTEEFSAKYPTVPVETDKWKLAKEKLSKKAIDRFSDPIEREKTAVATKAGMANPEVRERLRQIICHPLSNSTKLKMSKSISAALANPEVKKKMYTAQRNDKISKKKIQYWKDNPEKKVRVGNMWKSLKEKNPEKWMRHLSTISQKGFEAAWGKKETALESNYYTLLRTEKIEYIPQHPIAGKKFDAFIPSKNVLLEFDGTFWHPQTLEECQYQWQIKNYHNDREKDLIAKKHGLHLVRIREDAPISSIKTLLADIYNK